jgi:hypothetical protein
MVSGSISTIDTFVAGLSSEKLWRCGKKSKKGLRAEPALPGEFARLDREFLWKSPEPLSVIGEYWHTSPVMASYGL